MFRIILGTSDSVLLSTDLRQYSNINDNDDITQNLSMSDMNSKVNTSDLSMSIADSDTSSILEAI